MEVGKMKKALFLFLVLLLPAYCYASIVSTSGNMVEYTQEPNDLGLGKVESNSEMKVFYERQSYILQDNLQIDKGFGQYEGSNFIPANTVVNSYIIHVDPVGTTRITLTGSVTFDTDIIGIIYSTSLLKKSDSKLGCEGVNFEKDNLLRGLELSYGDSWSISNDNKTFSLNTYTDVSMDEIRIITAVPIPNAIFLLISGCGMIFIKNKKRNLFHKI